MSDQNFTSPIPSIPALRYISWFSCGAASATATKLALEEYGKENVRVVYLDTGAEHPDNVRFLAECQDWFGQEIEQAKSSKYDSIWDVFEQRRYLNGPGGALCTSEMKRMVAESMLDWGPDQQVEIFGYTSEEEARVERFMAHNTERKIDPILIRRGVTKSQCLGAVAAAGIELPAMYKLGYNNNNCIGCVKGGAGYWNKIREDFPEVFQRMAKLERSVGKDNKGASILRRRVKGKSQQLFLDELPKDFGKDVKPVPMDCGIMCDPDYVDEDDSGFGHD